MRISDWSSDVCSSDLPEFALAPIEGRQDGLSSADLQGQVSLVTVWASWCVPCRMENPLLVELAAAGILPIYGINYKDAPEEALAFLNELGEDRKSTRLNSSHYCASRMPSSARKKNCSRVYNKMITSEEKQTT